MADVSRFRAPTFSKRSKRGLFQGCRHEGELKLVAGTKLRSAVVALSRFRLAHAQLKQRSKGQNNGRIRIKKVLYNQRKDTNQARGNQREE